MLKILENFVQYMLATKSSEQKIAHLICLSYISALVSALSNDIAKRCTLAVDLRNQNKDPIILTA